MNAPLPRRTFLRGVGTAIALPFLDAMLPHGGALLDAAYAAPRVAAGKTGSAAGKRPLRMAFLYVPNGVHMKTWTPPDGASLQLPETLKPLQPFQSDLLVLSGLTQDKARPNGDGPGDHARAAAAFLTGCQPKKTGGSAIHVGVSVDQVAAAKIGLSTRFASLELGCDQGAQSGNCDSGYSCAYSNNISWKTESMFMAKEADPRLLFERLFPGIATKQGQNNRKYQKSILDFVLDDAGRLKGKLGSTDQRKVDEYLTGLREIEERLARAEKEARERKASEVPPAGAVKLGAALPSSIPSSYEEHIRLLGDLLALAFQADLTRVATFMIANEGSNRSYKNTGVADGHHDLSHHGGEAAKQEKVAKINRFHVEQLAYILKKLKDAKEGGRSVLDSCMVVYGSGISDGNRHNHNELPILLAGKGGGTIKTGRHLRFPKNTPLNNLFLSLLDRVGCPTDSLGDSTGRLRDIS